MPNPFKAKLLSGEPQFGLWLALANPYTAELLGHAGYDWLVIDGEHAPNDLPLMVAQLQALAASPSHPIVRAVAGETWHIKQLLDIGAQTLLVPMIESGAQAAEVVRACLYPPEGIRGVGAALARASHFGARGDYLKAANDELCLILQVESRAGLKAIPDIAALKRVDAIFIGPADLAADMGHLGNPNAPEVVEAVDQAIERIRSLGKMAGILTSSEQMAKRWMEKGATFVGIDNDVGLLARAAKTKLAGFKAPSGDQGAGY